MKATKQPSYWCVDNIGDANPMDYGGKFVLVDRTCTYDPIMIILEPQYSSPFYDEDPEDYVRCIVRLEPMIRASELSLSDNRFHPCSEAWFGNTRHLQSIADSYGMTVSDVMSGFLSNCPVQRAFAYNQAIDHFGVHEFDHYPEKISYEKAKKFCDTMFKQMEELKSWHEGYGVEND